VRWRRRCGLQPARPAIIRQIIEHLGLELLLAGIHQRVQEVVGSMSDKKDPAQAEEITKLQTTIVGARATGKSYALITNDGAEWQLD